MSVDHKILKSPYVWVFEHIKLIERQNHNGTEITGGKLKKQNFTKKSTTIKQTNIVLTYSH